MAPRQTSIVRFRFEDFIEACSSPTPGEVLAGSAATDEGGNNWRLLLRRNISVFPVQGYRLQRIRVDEFVCDELFQS